MMEKSIVKTADCIIMLLDICQELSVNNIQDILKQQDWDVCIALGWLAREKKITFIKKPNHSMNVCLNDRHLWNTLEYKMAEFIRN